MLAFILIAHRFHSNEKSKPISYCELNCNFPPLSVCKIKSIGFKGNGIPAHNTLGCKYLISFMRSMARSAWFRITSNQSAIEFFLLFSLHSIQSIINLTKEVHLHAAIWPINFQWKGNRQNELPTCNRTTKCTPVRPPVRSCWI